MYHLRTIEQKGSKNMKACMKEQKRKGKEKREEMPDLDFDEI